MFPLALTAALATIFTVGEKGVKEAARQFTPSQPQSAVTSRDSRNMHDLHAATAA